MPRYATGALLALGLGIAAHQFLNNSSFLTPLAAIVHRSSYHKLTSLWLDVFHWLQSHPYPAVIGGMFLYVAVLLTFSHFTQKNKYKLQEEKLKQQYQAYQTFQHYRRLRQWEQRKAAQQHEGQEQQQQQQQHKDTDQQSENMLDVKWGGMMGFGPQPVPQDCKTAVKEVLEAMDFYEVLGVAWNDTDPKVLKAARKAKALAVHPDKTGSSSAGCDLAASRVNAAFETLSNTVSQLEYDTWLARQS